MFALLALPDPLHPAVVHFPIVLLVLGTAIAVIAAFVPRGTLPLIAAALLALGAIGTIVGVQTGEREGEMIKETPAIEAILEEHEEWAERTQTVALIAAALAIGAVLTTKRWPKVGRTLGVVTAVGALAASYCVAEAGHYGGQLVYRHGAGVNLAPAGTAAANAPRKSPRENERH